MDIVLAVAIFIVTSATAYLGVRVTLHPAETAGAKRNYKIAFAALTVTAAGLITWQSILNRDEQGKLHSQLDHIQHNTETPPQVTVNVPAMPPTTVNIPPTPKPRATLMFSIDSPDMSGAAPFVNVAGTGWELSSACKNASQVVARRSRCVNMVGLIPAINGMPTDQSLKEAWAKFVKAAASQPTANSVDLEPGKTT